MPYRRNNVDFTINSYYQPMSMQEMMTPLVMYKDAYEKSEAAYEDLSSKADTFKYLAKKLEDNPDSEAAKIYKGYADELSKQAEDLARNGLSMNNRRALTNLKRRYQGEIGRLVSADEAMREEQKLLPAEREKIEKDRRQMEEWWGKSEKEKEVIVDDVLYSTLRIVMLGHRPVCLSKEGIEPGEGYPDEKIRNTSVELLV